MNKNKSRPDRLTYLTRRIGGRMGLPLSTLNHRTSAHFIEINYIYGAEMLKRVNKYFFTSY